MTNDEIKKELMNRYEINIDLINPLQEIKELSDRLDKPGIIANNNVIYNNLIYKTLISNNSFVDKSVKRDSKIDGILKNDRS